jgi:hypothetical protein
VSHISRDAGEPRFRTIVRLPTFERSAQGLLSEDEKKQMRRLIRELEAE